MANKRHAPLPPSFAGVFPLLDLPGAAVERVLGSVSDREDRRALRLAFKRGRAAVDRGVVAVETDDQGLSQAQLFVLSGAPWRLQRLCLRNCHIGAEGVATLFGGAGAVDYYEVRAHTFLSP